LITDDDALLASHLVIKMLLTMKTLLATKALMTIKLLLTSTRDVGNQGTVGGMPCSSFVAFDSCYMILF